MANRCGRGLGDALRRDYPWLKLIEAPASTSIPQLRALAMREASSDIVAVLEDHCFVGPDWAQQMIQAQGGGYDVIGGSVENAACERLVDWAAFFCEYSRVMSPVPDGEIGFLPGNNVSYKRWVLERFREEIESGIWDFILHERIRKEGIPLCSISSMTVRHNMSRSFGWFMTQKFHFARFYSSTRSADLSSSRRWLHGIASVLLPFLQAQRTISSIWKKGIYRKEFFFSFPILFLMLVSWSLGEAAGFFFGNGSSAVKVC